MATKILESTLRYSSRSQRTVKVTLNIRKSVPLVVDNMMTTGMPYRGHQSSRDRKTKSSADRHRGKTDAVQSEAIDGPLLLQHPSVYDGIKGSWPHHKSAKRYRREQLIEMVQRSLAENLSFQNQRYTKHDHT